MVFFCRNINIRAFNAGEKMHIYWSGPGPIGTGKRARVPIGTFFTFWVPISFLGSSFGYIRAMSVNTLCMYTATRKLVVDH